MYELVTHTIGPVCGSFMVRIYTNKGSLVTHGESSTKDMARRIAHQRLTSKISTTLVPIAPFHAL